MRLIDADALIGELHTTFLYDDDARRVIYRKIEEAPTVGGWITMWDNKCKKYVTHWLPISELPEEATEDEEAAY